MMSTRITLEMWRAFISVAEKGSSVKAAKTLNKSQSGICHSFKKMSLVSKKLSQKLY